MKYAQRGKTAMVKQVFRLPPLMRDALTFKAHKLQETTVQRVLFNFCENYVSDVDLEAMQQQLERERARERELSSARPRKRHRRA